MYFVLLLFLFATLSTVDSDIYSLNYIYTALSKPVELPGIHEFTAMGLMNDKQIDYYDSVAKKKIPKQNWMKDRLPADYWDKGTQSRKSKEQWFKVNVNILMERMRHNDTGVHILQWKHGCEIDRQSDGTLKFIKGTDQYSYDGDDFLAFDDATMQWVAPVDQALPTKRKWDGVQILNQYTKGYLEKECVDWLSKFMQYGEKEFSTADSAPKVYAFAKKAQTAGHVRLTCMATGFYPKDVLLHIKKNGVPLTERDGVQSTGVLPNDDETFQIRKSVQIPEADTAGYECFVNHRALKEPIVEKWDGKCCDCNQVTGVAIGAVVGVVLFTIVIFSLLVLWKKGKISHCEYISYIAGTKGALPSTGIHAPLIVAGTQGALPPAGIHAPLNVAGTQGALAPAGSNAPLNVTKEDPSSTSPGSVTKRDPSSTSPGSVTKGDPSSTSPGSVTKEDPRSTSPDSVTKEDSSSTSSDSGQSSNGSLENVTIQTNEVTKEDSSSTSSDSGQSSNGSLENVTIQTNEGQCSSGSSVQSICRRDDFDENQQLLPGSERASNSGKEQEAQNPLLGKD